MVWFDLFNGKLYDVNATEGLNSCADAKISWPSICFECGMMHVYIKDVLPSFQMRVSYLTVMSSS